MHLPEVFVFSICYNIVFFTNCKGHHFPPFIYKSIYNVDCIVYIFDFVIVADSYNTLKWSLWDIIFHCELRDKSVIFAFREILFWFMAQLTSMKITGVIIYSSIPTSSGFPDILIISEFRQCLPVLKDKVEKKE